MNPEKLSERIKEILAENNELKNRLYENSSLAANDVEFFKSKIAELQKENESLRKGIMTEENLKKINELKVKISLGEINLIDDLADMCYECGYVEGIKTAQEE